MERIRRETQGRLALGQSSRDRPEYARRRIGKSDVVGSALKREGREGEGFGRNGQRARNFLANIEKESEYRREVEVERVHSPFRGA